MVGVSLISQKLPSGYNCNTRILKPHKFNGILGITKISHKQFFNQIETDYQEIFRNLELKENNLNIKSALTYF